MLAHIFTGQGGWLRANFAKVTSTVTTALTATTASTTLEPLAKSGLVNPIEKILARN